MLNFQENYLIQIIPLGGVGEIGSNMTFLKTPGQGVVIDVGILFPDDDQFGLNYLIPDFNSLHSHSVPITDLIITHGHEDHIGAILHFVEAFPEITIWSPPFPAGLIRKKLQERASSMNLKLNIFTEDDELKFSHITIHPIHVNHSIPQTFGLLIQDKKVEFSCFFVSDFKYDESSPYEPPMNLSKLQRLSRNSKIRLLMADSTNVQNQGKTLSEGELIPALERVISQARGRSFVTFFPSNIHRLQTLIHIARKFGKKIVYMGKSSKFYSEMAHSLGLLEAYEETLLDEKSLVQDNKNVIILLSGCQGDKKGMLKKIVYEEHPTIRASNEDQFIFSSKTIPGNEVQIGRVWNRICEQGAHLITADEYPIHASGHPAQQDLLILYRSFLPTHFIPIHGETFLLKKHINYFRQHFPEAKAFFLLNHHSLIIHSNFEISQEANSFIPAIFIHGRNIPLSKSSLNQRKKMATLGLISISLQMGPSPTISSSFFGLPDSLEDKRESFHAFLASYIKTHFSQKEKELRQIEEILKDQIRKFFFPFLGYRPLISLHFFQ